MEASTMLYMIGGLVGVSALMAFFLGRRKSRTVVITDNEMANRYAELQKTHLEIAKQRATEAVERRIKEINKQVKGVRSDTNKYDLDRTIELIRARNRGSEASAPRVRKSPFSDTDS